MFLKLYNYNYEGRAVLVNHVYVPRAMTELYEAYMPRLTSKVHQRVKQYQGRPHGLAEWCRDKRKGRDAIGRDEFENRWSERTDAGRKRKSKKRSEREKERERERPIRARRVKPGKEKGGQCKKENIGNSISGGATSRTPEYISSSYSKRDEDGWRTRGEKRGVEQCYEGVITRFICNVPPFLQQLSYLSFSGPSSRLLSFLGVSFHRADATRICRILFTKCFDDLLSLL